MYYLKIVLIGIITLLTSCSTDVSQAQNPPTDWSEYELKGHVKQLIVKTYKAHKESGALVKDNLWSIVVVDFSPDGKLQQVDRKNESKEIYSYSKKQQIIKTFNANGVLTSQKVTNYTDWGAVQSIVFYNASGTQTGKKEYTYNKEHVLVERLYQDNFFQYTKEKNFQFDAVGREIRCERYNKENQLVEIETNTYRTDGKKIFTKVERYSDGVPDYAGSTRYTYNPEGFVSVVESATDSQDYQVTHQITYVYDSIGNYITKSTMYDWWPTIQERTIIYY